MGVRILLGLRITVSYLPTRAKSTLPSMSAKTAPPQTGLRMQMINLTGSLPSAVSLVTFVDMALDVPGSQLWKPGKLGTCIETIDDPVGSWHYVGDWDGVRVSILVFRTGAFKLGLGRGLPDLDMDPNATLELASRMLLSWTKQTPIHSSMKIRTMGATKRYIPITHVLDPWTLATLADREYETVIRPQRHRSGRFNAIRIGIQGDRSMHIMIDHGGSAHFVGFRSMDSLRREESRFDDLMSAFLKAKPPVQRLAPLKR